MRVMLQMQAARRSWLGLVGHVVSHPFALEMNEEQKLLEAQDVLLP